ncbi:MAG: DNA polymerase III subunit delta' [Bacillota bacterium]
MSFNKIPGQNKTKKILQDTISKNRISHAYLFNGNNGLGKLEMAEEFAQAIFCKNNIVDGCGNCISCRKLQHNNHPDFFKIEVQEDHSSILIEQIREMQKEISYKPYESEYKIYIINQAEKMTPEAQNSLLKTLEEPPDYAVIILTNEQIKDLIPTIISRCQKVKLYNQPVDVIKEFLIQEKGFDKKEASLYAVLSRGKYKKAVKLASKEDFVNDREKVMNFIANIDKKDNYEIYEFTDYLIKLSGKDFSLFELILSLFRDILVVKRNGNEDIINFDYKDLIINSIDKFEIQKLYRLIEIINKYQNYYLKNIKKDLLFPSLLFKIRNKKEL